jgi:hypothetical protein
MRHRRGADRSGLREHRTAGLTTHRRFGDLNAFLPQDPDPHLGGPDRLEAKQLRGKSIMRPSTKGPRSLIRNRIARPFCRLVTSTTLGSGSVLCAADSWFIS